MLGLREKIGAVGVVSTAPLNYQRSSTSKDDKARRCERNGNNTKNL